MQLTRCEACGAKALFAASQCPRCGHLLALRDAYGNPVPLTRCRSCDTYFPSTQGKCGWCEVHAPVQAPASAPARRVTPVAMGVVGVVLLAAAAWGVMHVARVSGMASTGSSTNRTVTDSSTTARDVPTSPAASVIPRVLPRTLSAETVAAPAPPAETPPATATAPATAMATTDTVTASPATTTLVPPPITTPPTATTPARAGGASPPAVASPRTDARSRVAARPPVVPRSRASVVAPPKSADGEVATKASRLSDVATAPRDTTTAPSVTPAVPDSAHGAVPSAPAPRAWTASTTRTLVQVRSQASRRATVVGVITPNTRVLLGESRAGWLRLRALGVSGWVEESLFAPDSSSSTH